MHKVKSEKLLIDKLLPRSSMWVLFGAFLMVMAPHYANISAWISCLSLGVVVWRFLVFKGLVIYPGPKIKTFLVITSVAGFYLAYRHQFSVETSVAFFVLAVSLKLIEVRFVKDCYLFVFILLYLAASQFLFSQTFMTAIYQIVSAFVALSVLFSLHKGKLKIPFKRRAVTLLKTVMVAVPLVIAIFMFFPRIAPLWSIPLSTGKAYTGISDSMSPGQIAELTQSSERAFRVSFSAEIPPKNQLYWRGLELDRLEGDTWRSSELIPQSFLGKLDEGRLFFTDSSNSYDILIEPTDRKWAYALANSTVASSNIYKGDSGYIRFKSNVIQPTQYRLSYSDDLKIDTFDVTKYSADSQTFRKYLQLPRSGNPQTRRFVNELKKKFPSSVDLIQYLMNYFREQAFHYTLRPPLTSDQFFDDFLFNTRRGFCSHYAGSLVYMLRLAGVPSRVVIGYQGGEVNEQENYLIVHQYDAHAWVEVWEKGVGWVRYDPTAMVAPSRVEMGLQEAVKEEGSFLSDSALAAARYNRIEFIRWMRLNMDSLNYNWQKWVVGYDGQTQNNLLSQWFGRVSFQSLAIIMTIIGGVIVSFAFLVLGTGKKQHSVDKVVLEFERFCKSTEKLGIKREVGETPAQFSARLIQRFPHLKEPLTHFVNCFNLLQYGRGVGEELKRNTLVSGLRIQARSLTKEMLNAIKKGKRSK
mgnify:CR=1 FL=1